MSVLHDDVTRAADDVTRAADDVTRAADDVIRAADDVTTLEGDVINVKYIDRDPRKTKQIVSWRSDEEEVHAVYGGVTIDQYNTELEWLKTLPPSFEQLKGKLFLGWYQTSDITSYRLPKMYREKDKIDMKSIIDNIPSFIISARSSLLRKLEADCDSQVMTITNPPRDIKDADVIAEDDSCYQRADNRLLSHVCEDCAARGSTPHTLYVMMDYLVELSVPQLFLKHFSTFKNKVQSTTPRSRPQSARCAQRWVFTQCHCHATQCYGNFFHTLDNFIPVLVVSHDMYDEYLEICKDRYVVVRLPVTSNRTTGYTNYWIQLLARKLALQQIWIVEDQVKSIYKTVPNQQLPITLSDGRWMYDKIEISKRLVSFSDVMTHLEDKMLKDESRNPNKPMSIIGLSNEICVLKSPYSYNIPIGIVLLNLKSLKDLKFHPEIHQIDMHVLACEAVKSGLRVFVSNSFVLLDSIWDK